MSNAEHRVRRQLAAACLLLCAALSAGPRACAEAATGTASEVMLRTSMEWLDAPGGVATVAAHAGEALRPGMRIRVHTHWRYVGTQALPPRSLVIDAAVPDWLQFVTVSGPRRGAAARVSADGFDFVGLDAARVGEQDAEGRWRAVRWVVDATVEPGTEGTLTFDALTR